MCITFKKRKKNYFTNLNEKGITDNRNFWHTAKPFFSEKNKSRESIVSIEKGKTIFKEDEVASTLNNFFSNIVKSINIPEHHINALHHRISNHPTLKAILKHKNHPSINTIRCATKHLSSFHFSQVDKKTVMKEIKTLQISKAVQDSDIHVKLLNGNAEFFVE